MCRSSALSAATTHGRDPDLAEQQQNRWGCLAVSRSAQQRLVARIQRQLLIFRKGLPLGRVGLTQSCSHRQDGGTKGFMWGRSRADVRGRGILGCSRELCFEAMSSRVCLLCCCCCCFFNPNACENKSAAQPVRLEVCPHSPQLLRASAGKSHGEDRAAPSVCLPSVVWHRPGACLLSPVPLPKAMALWSTVGRGADPWLWRCLSPCCCLKWEKCCEAAEKKTFGERGWEMYSRGQVLNAVLPVVPSFRASCWQRCLQCRGMAVLCHCRHTAFLFCSPQCPGARSTRVPAPVALGVSFGPNPTPGGFPVCASLVWDAASVGCARLH